MEDKVFIFLIIAFLSGVIGAVFSRKAKKSLKIPDLIISIILAVICLVFIIISLIAIIKSKM